MANIITIYRYFPSVIFLFYELRTGIASDTFLETTERGVLADSHDTSQPSFLQISDLTSSTTQGLDI